MCFYFGSGCLYPLKNCSKCSYTRYYVVFRGSLDRGLKVCILILLISSKLDLKRVFLLNTVMNRRCVTCFRDVAIHIIAVSRRLHSSNQYAFLVEKYRKCSFWKLSNRFWRWNIVVSRRQRCTCTKPDTFWSVLTQRNAGWKNWNNDHQKLLAM